MLEWHPQYVDPESNELLATVEDVHFYGEQFEGMLKELDQSNVDVAARDNAASITHQANMIDFMELAEVVSEKDNAHKLLAKYVEKIDIETGKQREKHWLGPKLFRTRT